MSGIFVFVVVKDVLSSLISGSSVELKTMKNIFALVFVARIIQLIKLN